MIIKSPWISNVSNRSASIHYWTNHQISSSKNVQQTRALSFAQVIWLLILAVAVSACSDATDTDQQTTNTTVEDTEVLSSSATSTSTNSTTATIASETANKTPTPQSTTANCLALADWLTADSLPVDSSQDAALCSPQQFAWQSFLYLANRSETGQPRFTSWMPSYGVFVSPGEAPVPFGKHPPDKCSASNLQIEELPATGTQPSFYSNLIKQAGSDQPLIDHNGNYVWYSIAINMPTYNMLTQCELYKEGCAGNIKPGGQAGGQGVDMQNYPDLAFPNGAVELKTSWKVLSDKEAASDLFYTTEGHIQTPAPGGECSLATLGLVGMHIVSKTPQDPSLTWATFEHRANAPYCTDLSAAPPIGKSWNFFNAETCDNCTTNRYDKDQPAQVCRMHPQGDSSLGIWPDGKDCDVDSRRFLCSAETQTMLAKNTKAINSINTSAQSLIQNHPELIDPVWSNYELTGNVWMKDGIDIQQINYMAGSLSAANTSMETFVQNGIAGQTADNNCFSCHTRNLGNGQYLPPAGLSHIYDKIQPGTGGCEAGTLPLACGNYHTGG